MALELINTTTNDVLDLLKTEYYKQTGQTIQIGSDEFASSAVQSYVWTLLFNVINEATKNRFIDFADGEYLDLIASNYGIESRPQGYHATAQFTIRPAFTGTISAGELFIKDSNDNVFTNPYDISVIENSYKTVTLKAVESGAKLNGIPENYINIVVDQDLYIHSGYNTTITAGGSDGFPYTPEGDDAFRLWLKNEIKSFSGAGTAIAYEGRAKNTDERVLDVYVLRQNDYGYEKGKVKIYIVTDIETDLNGEVLPLVQASCENEAFRPIGDLVIVQYAPKVQTSIQTQIQTSYPTRFVHLASARNARILSEYADELKKTINRPFVFEELCAMLTKKDDDGVFATDAKPLGLYYTSFPKPIYPNPGAVIDLQSVSIVISEDNINDH